MDKYARFEAWLRENGARFDQLELREYDCGGGGGGGGGDSGGRRSRSNKSMAVPAGGEEKKETAYSGDEEDEKVESEMRGVHAKSHIPPNTICMSIPRRCLITVEMGQATPIGKAIFQSDLDLDAPKHIYLMIYILWDRKVHGSQSFFAPYYDILPSTLCNMPIFWTQQELDLLQGSYLLCQIADRNQAIAEDYQTICSIAPALRQIATLEEFKWARMCVCSRNFGLQIDGHRTSALVPHADMLNHYRPRETKWTFDDERNAFTITTLQHIAAGAQVYDSYGQKCNHRFLLNYGFAVEDNRELDGFCPNEVPLELYVDPHDDNLGQKLEFWTRGETQVSNNNINNTAPSHQYVSNSLFTKPEQPPKPIHKTPNNSNKTTMFLYRGLTHYPSSVASSSGSASSSFNDGMAVAAPGGFPPANIIKRVRVCVSNNENTRLLFSLLRVLACNEAELKAISNSTTLLATGPSSSSSSLSSASDSSKSLVAGSTLFGFATGGTTTTPQQQQQQLQQQIYNVLTGTPTPTAYYRSCRDIRHPLSLRNETEAMRLLLDIVERHLTMYPTTLQQDVLDLQDLEAYPRFSNRRHAKIQVRGEKEVLHHYLQWAQTALQCLDLIAQELLEERTGHAGGRGTGGRAAACSNSTFTTVPTVGSFSSLPSVEVKLNSRTGHAMVSAEETLSPPPQQRRSSFSKFENLIRQMEDQEGRGIEEYGQFNNIDVDVGVGGVHHTILRYCSDVLGSLRREEFKNLGRYQGGNGGGSGIRRGAGDLARSYM